MAEATSKSSKATNGTTGRKSGETAGNEPAKAKFARAIDEAKAGAAQLGKEAQEQANQYRDKVASAGNDWVAEAKNRTAQAKDKATGLAQEGKARTSEGLAALGKLVDENAHLIDDKVGAKYGDYARKAASSMQDAAARLDAKSLEELGEDAKEMVRKSPAMAVGIAAVAGFMLARLFKGSSED